MVPGFTLIGKTTGIPDTSVNATSTTEYHGTRVDLADPDAVTVRLVTFPPMPQGVDLPEEVNFMHRTQSWDVGVVIEGKVSMALDGGSETVVSAGEVVVQRGTNHVSRAHFSKTFPCHYEPRKRQIAYETAC
jgi:mannose-6-phosphate isomerase-like protein (cupin superfamily)